MNSPELQEKLEEVLALEDQIQSLQRHRDQLRADLLDLLRAQNLRQAVVPSSVGECRLERKTVAKVEYQADLLRERLGDRFALLLEVDYRQFKKHQPLLRTHLQPVLEQVGTISKDRVRDALEQGLVQRQEFAGAFTKTEREVLYLRKPSSPEEEEPA